MASTPHYVLLLIQTSLKLNTITLQVRDATIYRYIAHRIVSRLYRNINTKLNCIDIAIQYCYIAVSRLVFIKLLD